jgi:signal transduction histidine kinase
MGNQAEERSGLSAADVAILGEREALQRLELLASTSRILDATLEDYDHAVLQVADACVPDFADMCAIEVIGSDGEARTAAFRFARTSGLHLPDEWVPIGRQVSPDRRPVLTFAHPEETDAFRHVRERFRGQSLMVVPITGGGLTLGWFVAATGTYRRGFRPSALRIGSELSSRLGTAIQRVMLHREMKASVRDQSRTVRRLRRLATAATNLAGAATTQAVLDIACVEACVIQEADGAIARWSMADGSVVSASAGQIDLSEAEVAFDSVANRRAGRGRGWLAYPLPSSDPWQQAALVVFVGEDFSADEELVLSSLASLIPVAFERALGTEAALRHETRLRAVVEASPVALIGLQADNTVTMANRAALELLGWGTDETEWLPPEGLQEPLAELTETVLSTGSVVNLPVSFNSRDLSLSGAPMPAISADDKLSVLVAGVDLSEIRRAEFALVQAQRLEAMGQVAGRVAHDFNNLLTLIIGYAELLRRGTADVKQQSLIDNIEGASKRAAALTQQMLDMTRQKVDSGVVIDLGREVEGLDQVLARMSGQKVNLRIRSSQNIIKVRLDPSEMEQIVVNLVINACDAMDGVGSVNVSVQMDVPTPEDRRLLDLPSGPLALLTVADDGPGMSEEIRERCLEPFFTTKERGQGSGLGLPTVYGLVKERGGQLRIDSEPGEGTSIRIWLPVARDAMLSTGSEGGESWPPGKTISGRILLVEDDLDLKDMAAETLAGIGLEVISTDSAESALDILAIDGPFDTLVTDIMLPGISGIELVAKARESEPGLQVLYMTGHSGATGPRMPRQGDQVLRKPYRPDALRLRVAELIASRVYVTRK